MTEVQESVKATLMTTCERMNEALRQAAAVGVDAKVRLSNRRFFGDNTPQPCVLVLEIP